MNAFYLTFLVVITNLAFGQSKTLAILPLNNLSNLKNSEVQSITHKLEAEISSTQNYNLVEREEMDKILKEKGFKETILCNDTECPQEIGSLLGADIILTGTLGKVGEIYSITAKLIEVKTGGLLTAQSVEAQDIESLHINGTTLLAQKLSKRSQFKQKNSQTKQLDLNINLNPFGISTMNRSDFNLYEIGLSANYWFQPQWGASAQINLGYFKSDSDSSIIAVKEFDINYSDFDLILYQGIKTFLSFKSNHYIISPFISLNQGSSTYESALLLSNITAELELIEFKYGIEGTYLLGKNKNFGITAGASLGTLKTTLTGAASSLEYSKELSDTFTQVQIGCFYRFY